jgi:hypothetical protein
VRPILAIVDRRNNLKVAASYCPGHYFCDQRMAFVALKEWHFWHSIVNVAFSHVHSRTGLLQKGTYFVI